MELLAPGGNLQKIKYAVHYGADAVYTAGKDYGLRAKSSNLTNDELAEAVDFCHANNSRIFVAVNIFAHNNDLTGLPDYLAFLQAVKVDALIISDPAIFVSAGKYASEIPIHISTQANVTSWKAAEFWSKLGARRVILARELTINEIKKFRERLPELELEMFVHGAMCISYSGRCLLSSFLNARSANKGFCTHPCRWQYHLKEESREGQFFAIEEDQRGTYILNSKDLCLLNRLSEIVKTGLNSIKIEGRMKSLYYVANVTRIYKEALLRLENGGKIDSELMNELDKVSHRPYSEAFFDKFSCSTTQFYDSSAYLRKYQFIGEIVKVQNRSISVAVRAKFKLGDKLEFIFPNRHHDFTWLVDGITDEEGNSISFSKPNTIIKLHLPQSVSEHGIIRVKK